MVNYNDILNNLKEIITNDKLIKTEETDNHHDYSSCEDYKVIEFNDTDVRVINTNSAISYYRKIYNNKIIFFIKRVIRKLVKFIVEPITIDISNYNRSNTKIVMQLIENNQKLHNQYNQLKKENELLVERIIEIEKSLKK